MGQLFMGESAVVDTVGGTWILCRQAWAAPWCPGSHGVVQGVLMGTSKTIVIPAKAGI